MLKLSRRDFWELTPGEFRHTLEGHQESLRDQSEINHTMLAWQTAHLINIWLAEGKKITLDDLMGIKKRVVPDKPAKVMPEMPYEAKRELFKKMYDDIRNNKAD